MLYAKIRIYLQIQKKKIYQDFPQYKDLETYFQVGARKINRFRTIEENNIKNNDVISVFVIDN